MQSMLPTIVAASVLAAVTALVHAVGLGALINYLLPGVAQPPMDYWRSTRLLVVIVWALLLIHAIEIAIWALFYLAAGCLPDAESAFYFSGVTYATIGYGDLVLPEPWRMLGPVEGLVGILMCGLSTALFFAFLGRVYVAKHKIRFDRLQG
jgi:hypothetical protein